MCSTAEVQLPRVMPMATNHPLPTTNIKSISIDAATGIISINTQKNAGDGLLLLVPYTGQATSASLLPDATAEFSMTEQSVVAWRCMAKGASAPTGLTLGVTPTLLAKVCAHRMQVMKVGPREIRKNRSHETQLISNPFHAFKHKAQI
jgi:hypothetical protein